jgi:hypothetical protein
MSPRTSVIALPHMKPDRTGFIASKQNLTGATLLHEGLEAYDERIGKRRVGTGPVTAVQAG